MSNNFYNHGTFPSRDVPGSSAALRAELDLIGAGFEKMPTLTGNGLKLVRVNILGTALEAVSTLTSITIDNVVIGGTTPAAGTFTTLEATSASFGTITTTGNVTVGGDFAVTGSFSVPTLAPGSSGTQAASVDYVNATVTSAVLPGQTGNAGKVIFTDGTTASWGAIYFQSGATAAEIRTGSNTTKVVAPSTLLTAMGVSDYVQTADQVITSAGALTIAHGLARAPKLFQCFLKCTTSEFGYSIGDVIPVGFHMGTAQGSAITFDTTNLYIRFGLGGNAFPVLNKTTGADSGITNNRWSFFVRAWA